MNALEYIFLYEFAFIIMIVHMQHKYKKNAHPCAHIYFQTCMGVIKCLREYELIREHLSYAIKVKVIIIVSYETLFKAHKIKKTSCIFIFFLEKIPTLL